jgi:ribosomal peptide maturation radical SAM protein 1
VIAATDWKQYRAVGFTATFQQSVASFALAARIKAAFPGITTFFGGSNFEGEMGEELVRTIDCIDYAVAGEADTALPEFLSALLDGRDPSCIAGVICRRGSVVTARQPRALVRSLDESPIPDYTEFFERSARLGLAAATERPVRLPFESARGCWWAKGHQCTFCGLNGTELAYRSKSPDRVERELAELTRRYKTFRFEAVDDILNPSYITRLCPRLEAAHTDYDIFYEVKANLSREQVRKLHAGGIRRIQPGIESFSTRVLELMKKGVTALENINLLRWALHYRVFTTYNIIWGFPGETVEDNRNQLSLLRKLSHLPPPYSAGRLWMERFSPLYADRASYPARWMRPEKSYEYVYPAAVNLDRVAYFFDYELENTLPDQTYADIVSYVAGWQDAWQKSPIRPKLVFRYSPGFISIEDSRACDRNHTQAFDDERAEVYLACCDRPRRVVDLHAQFAVCSPSDIESILDEFCAQDLMVREDDTCLSLATPATVGT